MKNSIKVILISLLIGINTTSCEEFLDVPPDATLTEEGVFSSYNTFQGFIDPCYDLVSDPNSHCLSGSANYGTESINVRADLPVGAANVLDYNKLGFGGGSYWTGNVAKSTSGIDTTVDGLWDFWPYACRISNIALNNLDKLRNTSKEERDKLEGQALFFRAYFNYQIVIAYGTIPYLDQVYDQDNIQQPRHWTDTPSGKKDSQAVLEKAARDLQRAAELLPVSWGNDAEIGRITKGASLALLSKVLLFAGSPLFEEVSEKGVVSAEDTPFDKDYMTRAATAAAAVLKLNVYNLTPFGTPNSTQGDGIKRMFVTTDNKVPYTDEIIFKRFSSVNGPDWNFWARIFVKGAIGLSTGGCENPNLLYMDKFEMKDGTPYKPGNSDVGGYDDNLTKFNDERDPRFQYNYYLHGETINKLVLNFSNRGQVQSTNNAGPFLLTKLWLHGVDGFHGVPSNFNYGTPLIRLADVYLIYAEAVFEATGNPDASIGGGPTARQALNMVRARSNMPDYNPATYATARINHGELSSDDPFRLAVRNERNVELAYEGHYWFDIRRWKRWHRLDNKLWILYFTQANPNVLSYTNVSRLAYKDFNVLLKHYWLPFSTKDTQYYEGFEQNPGW